MTVVSVLPRMVLLAGAVLCGTAAAEEVRTATLTVPAASLVFDGLGLNPPDEEGHFFVGIRLPQPSIRAAHCGTPNLPVGLVTLRVAGDTPTAKESAVIARSRRYYDELVARSKGPGPVSIRVRNGSAYLRVTDKLVFAAYCTLSIDESSLP